MSESSEQKLKFVVPNIRDQVGIVFSKSTSMKGIPWQLRVEVDRSSPSERPKFLGIHLKCYLDRTSKIWKCEATATITLDGQNTEIPNITRGIDSIFDYKQDSWGYKKFLKFEELFTPGKELVTKDGSLTIEVTVTSCKITGIRLPRNSGPLTHFATENTPDLSSDLKKLLLCPVCDQDLRNPRILPECGHPYCLDCLENMSPRGVNDFGGTIIECVTCREESMIEKSLKDLPKPHMISELKNKLDNDVNSRKKAKMVRYCDFCMEEGEEIQYFCHFCSKGMCHECQGHHAKQPRFESHCVEKFSKVRFCNSHPTESYQFVCWSCDVLACQKCIFNLHDQHVLDNLHEAAEVKRKGIPSFIDDFMEKTVQPDAFAAARDAVYNCRKSYSTAKESLKDLKKLSSEVAAQCDMELKKLSAYEAKYVVEVINFRRKVTDRRISETEYLRKTDVVKMEDGDFDLVSSEGWPVLKREMKQYQPEPVECDIKLPNTTRDMARMLSVLSDAQEMNGDLIRYVGKSHSHI